MTGGEITEMYQAIAFAKMEQRFSIPSAYAQQGHDLEEAACSLDFDGGPGMLDSGPFGESSGRPVPVSVETFHALKDRQTADQPADPNGLRGRVNLLNWDGKGAPPGLFPRTRPGRPKPSQERQS